MTVRFAILGAGRIGQVHARAVTSTPDATLVAIADPVADAAQMLYFENLVVGNAIGAEQDVDRATGYFNVLQVIIVSPIKRNEAPCIVHRFKHALRQNELQPQPIGQRDIGAQLEEGLIVQPSWYQPVEMQGAGFGVEMIFGHRPFLCQLQVLFYEGQPFSKRHYLYPLVLH